ncbi:MAG: SDR family NAD(P)-dependent oxidoreductase [Gammaproteobacteria bacterium]
MNWFKNKVIYITGGSAGIGKAIAKRCLIEGASVIITGRTYKNLEIARKELSAISPNLLAHEADVSNIEQVSNSVEDALKVYGKIDGLVNNAPSIHTGLLSDLSYDAWRTNFKANLDGVFLLCQKIIPHMRANSHGSIVNISSVVGLKGTRYMGAYGAAKAGLINLTQTMAIENAPNIRVNCVVPGAVMTPATSRAIPNEDMLKHTAQSIPLKRIADPDEIAIPVMFLLSDQASFITGQTLVVDGGKTADLNAGN